eukprot:6214588-Pleurochrysis_carterae.AAC.2
MLAQLEERGFVKSLSEAVGHLITRADEVSLIEPSSWHSRRYSVIICCRQRALLARGLRFRLGLPRSHSGAA